MRKRRLGKFEEHFPEALDLLGRAVRAGHAFTTGMEMIAKESEDPIGGEFRTTFEEQNFGLPLRDTLDEPFRASTVDGRSFFRDFPDDSKGNGRQSGGDSGWAVESHSRAVSYSPRS